MNSFGDFPSITTPFGAADSNIQMPDGALGITEKEACPYANGGTQISRHKMNGIGYLATLGAFLDRVGYPYGYTPGISYPKGAIVTMFDSQRNRIYEFVNTVDNNRDAPMPDMYIDETNQESTYNGWTVLTKVNNYSFFPDYTSRKLIATLRVAGGGGDSITISPDRGGWVLVTRTIAGWDRLTTVQKLGLEGNGVEVRLGVYSIYQRGENDEMSIRISEGEYASRFLPCPDTMPISIPYVPVGIKSVTVNVYFYSLEDS